MSRRGRLFKSLDEGGESLLTNAELQQICNTVWTEIRQYTDDSGRRLSELFESLPSKTDYPDYYEVITRPVALETIKHTIDAGGYSSIDAFHADLEQMFTNAKTYNVRGSQVYTDAVALQKLADSYLESYLSNNLMDIDETQPDGASDEYRELLSAISHNDTSRALSMIQQPGFNPNQLGKVEMFGDEFTWGALHCAAYYGNIKVIDALMERGANVEMRDTWHRGTPLAWAAFAGHVDTVRRLVAKYNANIYSKNMHGQVAYDLVSEPEDEAWFNLLTTTRPDKVKRRGRPPKHSVTSTIDQERNQEGGKRYRRQSKSELGSGNESDEEDYMEEEEEEEDEEEEADDMDVADEDEYMNGKRTNRTPSKPKKSSLDGSSITDIASPTIDDTISTPSKATIGTGGGAEFGIDVSNQKRPKSARLLREILYSITEYRDETGRRLAEPFIELPTEEKYPGYQRKVRRLASFNKIENRIKRGYDSFERYERECMRVLDNALLYFKETSQEYKDALFLKDLMKKNIVAIITKYENCTETPAGIDPRIKLDLTGRYTGKSIEVNGVEYTLGEFVYVHDQRDIMIIDRIYLHAEKEPLMIGRLFIRPNKVPAAYGRKVVTREVYKTLLSRDFCASDIRGKCLVIPMRDFYHSYPTDFAEEDVYVCNNRYSERATRPFPYISDWQRSIGVDNYRKVRMTRRPEPIRLQKFTLIDENTLVPVVSGSQQQQQHHHQHRALQSASANAGVPGGVTLMSDEDETDAMDTPTPSNINLSYMSPDGIYNTNQPIMLSPTPVVNHGHSNATMNTFGQLSSNNIMLNVPGLMPTMGAGVNTANNISNATNSTAAMGTNLLDANAFGINAAAAAAASNNAANSTLLSNLTHVNNGLPDGDDTSNNNNNSMMGETPLSPTSIVGPPLPPGTLFLAEVMLETDNQQLRYRLDPRQGALCIHVQESIQKITLRPKPAELLQRRGLGPTVFVYQNARPIAPSISTVVTMPNGMKSSPTDGSGNDQLGVNKQMLGGNRSVVAKTFDYPIQLVSGLNALEVWASVPTTQPMAMTVPGQKPEMQQFSIFITKT